MSDSPGSCIWIHPQPHGASWAASRTRSNRLGCKRRWTPARDAEAAPLRPREAFRCSCRCLDFPRPCFSCFFSNRPLFVPISFNFSIDLVALLICLKRLSPSPKLLAWLHDPTFLADLQALTPSPRPSLAIISPFPSWAFPVIDSPL